jgi:hypothetical protein
MSRTKAVLPWSAISVENFPALPGPPFVSAGRGPRSTVRARTEPLPSQSIGGPCRGVRSYVQTTSDFDSMPARCRLHSGKDQLLIPGRTFVSKTLSTPNERWWPATAA